MRSLKRAFTSLVFFLALIAPALADPIQYPDGSWRWSAVSRWIPEVSIHVGDICDIQLEPGEKIRQAIISDSLRWKLTDGESGTNPAPHLFLKPTEENIRAFLTITTSRRVYHVRLLATSDVGHEFIGFYYPQPPQPARPRPQPASTPPTVTCAGPLDAAYRWNGAREFQPRSACNDGAHTYINMGPIDGGLPVLVVIGDDGHDQIGNFSYNAMLSQYTIDGVAQRLALLRNGGKGQLRVNIQRFKK